VHLLDLYQENEKINFQRIIILVMFYISFNTKHLCSFLKYYSCSPEQPNTKNLFSDRKYNILYCPSTTTIYITVANRRKVCYIMCINILHYEHSSGDDIGRVFQCFLTNSFNVQDSVTPKLASKLMDIFNVYLYLCQLSPL
jgi:hypothetical protein